MPTTSIKMRTLKKVRCVNSVIYLNAPIQSHCTTGCIN